MLWVLSWVVWVRGLLAQGLCLPLLLLLLQLARPRQHLLQEEEEV